MTTGSREAEPALHNARRRVAIIGGGLAGLSATLRLIDLGQQHRRPLELTLFEAGARLGGALETVSQAGYLIERGADSFLTNKPAAVGLCERLGIAEELLPTDNGYRGALVLHRGRPVPVPAGFNLMAPARLGPMLTTPLLSLRGKLRLLAEPLVPPRKNDGDESLESFAVRRLGREMFDRLVQPLVSGIYTADPQKLSLAATLPRFLDMERAGGLLRAGRRSKAAAESASGARYGLFAGLRGGMRQLLTALVAEVERHATICVEKRVTGIRRVGKAWQLDVQPQELPKGDYDAVVLALPAFRAAELLGDAAGDLAELLRRIPYASSVVVATGHRLADVAHPLKAFGLVVPHVERRNVLAVSFASRKFPDRAPEGCVLLRTFAGGALRPELAEASDAELTSLVRAELAELLGVRGDPRTVLVSRYPHAMPQYHVGHLQLVHDIENVTGRYPGLHLVGSAYRGVGIPDVVKDGQHAAEKLFQSLGGIAQAAY